MSDLSQKFCFQPWDFMEIQDDLSIFNCCPNWIDYYSYGKLDSSLNTAVIWNGEKAQEFRKSILDGSFKFCNRTLCPYIQNNSLPNRSDILEGKYGTKWVDVLNQQQTTSENPTRINLSYDKSCNLKCPS